MQRAPAAAAAVGRAAFAHARFLLTRRERPRPADR
jgi:hypothetical protein